jgi:phage terminase large subunit GpA-like protein
MSDSTSPNLARSGPTSPSYEGEADIVAAWHNGLRPDPDLTVSQWADRYRMLSTRMASESGRYRTERVPYLREVMDALSPQHPARKIVFMKAAQVGATESGNNWLGYIMHWSPAPVLAVWPTLDTAKKMSLQRIEPLIEDTPELLRLVQPSNSRDSGNTQYLKTFPGGILALTGANSGVGLRAMPARYAFCDEVDAYPGDVDGEGDPVALIANRTTTFGHSSKQFLISTPTIHGISRIEREYDLSDQRRFFVPCPHCGAMQWLQFERLRWERGRPETVHYVCEECEEPIAERHKTTMLPGGAWHPTAIPVQPHTVGFHISALYSPLGWLSWEDIAREWEAAQGKVALLKTFKNTRLGETWFEDSDAVDWQRVYERRETWKSGTVPDGVTMLTGFVDVQRDRMELHVWGWGAGLESWAVDRVVAYGKADELNDWRPIEEALAETYRHPSGVDMTIDVVGVDTGDQTTAVYRWLVRQDQTRVLAMKGKAGFDPNTPVATPTYVPLGRKKRAIRLRSVMGDVFKAELYRFLALPKPDDEHLAVEGFPTGYVHVPDYLDAEWCRQLVAERRYRTKSGRYEWRKEHERNEALDCRVGARAALWTLNATSWTDDRWQKLREKRGLHLTPAQAEAEELQKPHLPSPPPAAAPAGRRVVRSSYLGR